MIETIDDLARGAIALPPEQRFTLAQRILASLEPEGESGNEEAWADEIRERIQRYNTGETIATPAEKMKSEENGTSTLEAPNAVQVQGISPHGFWILIKGQEYFLDFESYPWFKNARIDQIFNVTLLHGHHLFWDELDVDLEISSLNQPEQYPLISKSS